MRNVQFGSPLASFNTTVKPPSAGPSLAEIRNVEIQKNAPTVPESDESKGEEPSEEIKDDEERAA